MLIPTAKSVTELMVFKTDWYANKDTGVVRASIQAIAAIPADAIGNAKGFELTEYNCDPSVIEFIDFANGPFVGKFEGEMRPISNRFGKTTNTTVFTRLIPAEPAQRTAPAPAPVKPEQQKTN